MSFYSLIAFIAAAVGGTIGFAVLFHETRTRAHFLFVAGMFVLAAESFCIGMATSAAAIQSTAINEATKQLAIQSAVGWQRSGMAVSSLLPGMWLLFSFVYARGNAAEFVSRWKWGLAASFVVPIGVVIAFYGELILSAYDPKTRKYILDLPAATVLLQIFLLLSAVLVLMNLERTFRSAVGTMRWRIKFMVLGLGVLFSVRAYTSSQFLLFRTVDPAMQALNSSVLLLGGLLIIRSLFRAGHFQVRVYPSHSVITNSLTVLVAGVYLVLVGLLAKAVTVFGGGEGASGFTIKAFLVLLALVLLTVVLLSDRVRVSTKRFLSRHFQRPLYDYRSVWKKFTEGTASRVEQSELCGAVVRMVSDIFQALSVTMWLVDERKERLLFAASSTLSESKAGQVALEREDAQAIIRAMGEAAGPIDIDSSKEVWAAALRLTHPDEFRHGGNRVCVPLVASGELLGIMTLGDRVGGIPFSVQDLDLLKSVSDQSAANLLNIELSQRLSRAKQLEAFQAMSAFFVHDLKNTASTLTLMLQNLPVHYQDPKFREDALRGISKTVQHINDLIQRLGVLRHELVLRPVECDLNELLQSLLKGVVPVQGVEYQSELQPLPKLHVDPEQIQKVVTNLLFNAREAVLSGGQIRVETNRQNNWAVLAVKDNGCGMSPEFVQRKLFRPFETTKKRGIGIGMFHCKMIVEAHRGRIEVETEQGKGTCFRVLLPISA